MNKLAALFLSALFLLAGCAGYGPENHCPFTPRPGDLLFQDLDCGELCEAIEKVTTGYDGADFSHVGVVAESEAGELIVIEAVTEGVTATPLAEYLSRSLDDQGRPKIAVGRLKKPYRHLIGPALEEAFSLIGKPYDKPFVVGNDAYYCSELIYEIFLRANKGKPVFELAPMTFKDPESGTIFPAWQGYFSKLGISVPEGQPGINPGGISLSPAIVIIHTCAPLGER